MPFEPVSVANAGADPVAANKTWPFVPEAVMPAADDPLPYTTPFCVKLVCPVPPRGTVTGFVKFTVSVDPDPLVVMPLAPATVSTLELGVAVPESVTKLVGTAVVADKVIEPAPGVTVMPVPAVRLATTGAEEVEPIMSWPFVAAPTELSLVPS